MTYSGGGNFVNQFIWKKNSSGKTVSKQFPVNIEYLLMFAKQLDKMSFNVVFKPLSEATIRMYSKDDNDGRGKYRLYPMQKTGSPGPETTYDYIDNSGKIWQCPEKGWRMIKTKMKALENDGRLCLSNETISEKAYWNERDDEGKVADTLWDDLDEGNIGTGEINKLFTGAIFDYPKPTGLLSRGIKIGTNRDDIILDFFSGSATTAHAVMKLNAEDGGNRKYIMVQIPEKCDEKSEAFKEGYKTIAEIGKERIRRAGEKIKAEMTEKDSQQLSLLEDKSLKANLDIGFKVFKLDETNFTQWDEETTDPAGALLRSVQSIKPNRTSEDALYEILLKYGIDLTLPVTELEIDSRKVFSLAANYLLVCLEKNLSLSTIEEIAKLKPERVVFYDDAFKDDVVKLNAEQTLRKFGVEDLRVI
jgi:adenine-specific DNA-methyltransferase